MVFQKSFLHFILLYSIALIHLSLNKDLSSSLSYFIEFDILEYTNPEGRLLNGECCSGYKSTLGHGLCRGGNSTCKPYFKICLTNFQEASKNGTLMMPTQRRRNHAKRSTDKNITSPIRQSIFKNWLNKLMSSIKVVNFGESTRLKPVNQTLVGITATNTCSIAYWVSDGEELNTGHTVRLKANIPQSIIFNSVKEWTDGNRSEVGEIGQKVLVFVEIWHRVNGTDEEDKLIERYLGQRNVSIQLFPSDDIQWQDGGMSSNVNTGVIFKYRLRIFSSYKYSSNTLTTCPPGYKGVDCSEAICKPGCHKVHGHCEKPNECKCKFGWTGDFCSLCTSMPGCVHGVCSKPFECKCEKGWNGMFCDKPTCKLGCHLQNGYCEHPGECRCRFGYKGENCTECETMPGCQHGLCQNPLDCICKPGWTGLFCNIAKCSTGCDIDNGWCKRPQECRCRIGWKGANCTECVAYPGCENGKCNQPWTCNCDLGWGGITCSEKLDFCETHENPCLHNGQCISIERSEGSFLCKCSLGYHGKVCEKIKS